MMITCWRMIKQDFLDFKLYYNNCSPLFLNGKKILINIIFQHIMFNLLDKSLI